MYPTADVSQVDQWTACIRYLITGSKKQKWNRPNVRGKETENVETVVERWVIQYTELMGR